MKTKTPACPKCGRKATRYRAKDGTFVCGVCGHTWQKTEGK